MKTTMKTVIWSLALAGGLLAALPAQAQEQAQEQGQGEKPRQERRGGGGGGMNIEAMKERLGLTEEQVAKLKPILAAQREEIAAKRKELGKDADRETTMEAMKSIREKYKAQIEAVLTPEQKEKLAAARERGPGGQGGSGGEGRKAKGPKGQGGEGEMPPPPPAAE